MENQEEIGSVKLEQAILQLSAYIEKYPYAFEKFGEEFPDVTKWDRLFVITKLGSLNGSLRTFFLKHWLLIQSTCRVSIAGGVVIGADGMAEVPGIDNSGPYKKYKLNVTGNFRVSYMESKNVIVDETGDMLIIYLRRVEWLFAALDKIMQTKEKKRLKINFNKIKIDEKS